MQFHAQLSTHVVNVIKSSGLALVIKIFTYASMQLVAEQTPVLCHHADRPISQTVFMLSIAINRAEHVCAIVIIKHNYMLMCNHKIVINIMLCLLNSTGHI